MGRKSQALEFRRPKRRNIAVRNSRTSKFRPAGRLVPARAPLLVSPFFRMWIIITGLVPAVIYIGAATLGY